MNAIARPVGTDYRLPLRPRRRKLVNTIALSLSLAAMAFGLVWLIWILWDTLWLGIKGLSAAVFLQDTPPPNADAGGLRNAIIGSAGMVLAATAVGTPIGILAGIYLAEYGPARLARQRHALHQRHPAFRAVDRHRALRLHDHRRADAPVFRIRRHRGAGADRDPGRGPDDREHACADPQRVARGDFCARRTEVGRDPARDPQGGARRCRHWGAARGRPDRRRNRAAAALLRSRTSSSRSASISRWRACRSRSSSSR